MPCSLAYRIDITATPLNSQSPSTPDCHTAHPPPLCRLGEPFPGSYGSMCQEAQHLIYLGIKYSELWEPHGFPSSRPL